MNSNISRVLTLTLVAVLSSSCPQNDSPPSPVEEAGGQEGAVVGERVVSVWTLNHHSEIIDPPESEPGWEFEGRHVEDNIQGTFRVIEVEHKVNAGTALEHTVIDYRIEGSASGVYTTQEGSWREVQQGFYLTTTTECPSATHSYSAGYTLSGYAKNGFVNLDGQMEDGGEHSGAETIEAGTCTIEVLDQRTNERRVGTRPNKLTVNYIPSFRWSFHPDENWEHDYVSEDGQLRMRTWVHPIETMPCTVQLSRNSTLVTCEESSLVFASLPEGSDYQWSIVSGGDKARVSTSYPDRPIAEVELTGKSESANDIVIKGSYTGEDGVRRSCTGFLTAIAPTQLEVLTEQNIPLHEQNGVWSVGAYRKYQVLDQFGEPVRQEGLVVSERFTSIDWMGNDVTWDNGSRELSYNPNDPELVGPDAPRLPFQAVSWYTNEEGTFEDTPRILREGTQFPYETNLVIYQDIFVEGCLVGKNTIHFLRDSASVATR